MTSTPSSRAASIRAGSAVAQGALGQRRRRQVERFAGGQRHRPPPDPVAGQLEVAAAQRQAGVEGVFEVGEEEHPDPLRVARRQARRAHLPGQRGEQLDLGAGR